MSPRLRTGLLLAPAALWLLAMLVLPLVVVLVFSFGERAAAGGYSAAFTFENFANLGTRWAAFKNTLMLAPVGTLLCLLIAYPMAMGIARATRIAGAGQVAQIADLYAQSFKRRTELGHTQGIGPHGRAKARGTDIGGQTDQCGRCVCHEPLRFRPSYGPQD